MNLYLRRVIHSQAPNNYRVILKCEDGEFEIGSIGIQFDGGWSWGIDTVIPMRATSTVEGSASGADSLTGADLTGAGVDLIDANLRGANLTGADLTDAYLTGADLTDANLTDANLTDADLTQAKGLDKACGNAKTKLPEGFSVKPCPEKR